jgi:hypothetical protein
MLAVVALALPAACKKSPGAPSVSFTSPIATGPSNGSTFKFSAQPISVVINNAVRTSPTTVTYTVEVATDEAFTNRVFTREGIEEGAGGTTTVTLGALPGGASYFWRSRSSVEGVLGDPSAPQGFTIQPQIILNAPAVVDPAPNSSTFEARPTFTLTNSTRSGPAGTIFYEFQVSTSSSFNTIVASATIQEQQTRTSWTVQTDLPAANYFWRARATDPSNTEVSPFSGGAPFELSPFDLPLATILHSPAGIAHFAITTKIESIDISQDGIVLEFDKKDGPGRWPDVLPPGWDGGIQYSIGMVLKIDGKFFASAPIEMWNGRGPAGAPPQDWALEWFYDPNRWAPMTFHQPAVGEQVGMFVVAGDTRGEFNQDLSPVKERSNVVFFPMPSFNGAFFRFTPSGAIIH